MTSTLKYAAILWEFLSEGRQHKKCDLLVVCGSYDLRVCDYACELLRKGVAEHLLFTGNTGNWTRHLWDKTEAEIFAQRALDLGVLHEQFSLEKRATNFAENIAFAKEMFPQIKSATFLTKPNSIRRVKLTLPIQWAGLDAWVDAPRYCFPEQTSNQVGVLGLIDEMVGDIQRIMVYPKQGFQIEEELPKKVQVAWKYLIEQGFKNHLIS
ncbi:YdcF family protein [Pseudomonas sp. MWU13-2517]|uniref:YdcF family protein n=1 Tax=Pseudomonas sp. MWU13-2517 TaxID=2929055 RepID=UPI0020106EE7|nr:YdcF family protein [Pseudomonas sp. MWU13-2517]